jgi:hypothetical protein
MLIGRDLFPQILSVIENLPRKLTIFGIDILFASMDEVVPEIGNLLEVRRANERMVELRVSATEADQFFTLARQIFGGQTRWPMLTTVGCLKKGRWDPTDVQFFTSFPTTITSVMSNFFFLTLLECTRRLLSQEAGDAL